MRCRTVERRTSKLLIYSSTSWRSFCGYPCHNAWLICALVYCTSNIWISTNIQCNSETALGSPHTAIVHVLRKFAGASDIINICRQKHRNAIISFISHSVCLYRTMHRTRTPRTRPIFCWRINGNLICNRRTFEEHAICDERMCVRVHWSGYEVDSR